MAWRGRAEFGVALQNPLGWLIHNLPCNLAVFRDGGVRYVRKILVYAKPGPHDALVASTADHLAELFRAQLTFVRMVTPDAGEDKRAAEERYMQQLQDLCRSQTSAKIVEGLKPSEAIASLTGGYDLLVAGAAHKKGVLKHIQALAEPTLIEKANVPCLFYRPRKRVPIKDFKLKESVLSGLRFHSWNISFQNASKRTLKRSAKINSSCVSQSIFINP